MSFLNKKEQVINLELTSHGRRMLAKGEFKPDSYSFFDDDILYDGLYAFLTESHNDVEDRILNTDRPALPGQFYSAETSLKEKKLDEYKNNFIYSYGELGNSSMLYDKAAAYQVKYHNQ